MELTVHRMLWKWIFTNWFLLPYILAWEVLQPDLCDLQPMLTELNSRFLQAQPTSLIQPTYPAEVYFNFSVNTNRRS